MKQFIVAVFIFILVGCQDRHSETEKIIEESSKMLDSALIQMVENQKRIDSLTLEVQNTSKEINQLLEKVKKQTK